MDAMNLDYMSISLFKPCSKTVIEYDFCPHFKNNTIIHLQQLE